MKKTIIAAALTAIVAVLAACTSDKKIKTDMTGTQVKIETNLGNIVVLLYDDTPLHRDNFIKLANEGTYKGTLFHRVINEFMIQAGDPDSRTAQPGQMLGMGDVGYTIPAEFVYPTHFHKRGALAAAREGDQTNPEKASSGCQFYIVTGKVYTDSLLVAMEDRANQARLTNAFNDLAAQRRDEIRALQQQKKTDALMDLQDQLIVEAQSIVAQQPAFTFTAEQRAAYTTGGGVPHLDGEYTVFGEVLQGMEVVDEIQHVETDQNDRPLRDVVIKKVTVLQ